MPHLNLSTKVIVLLHSRESHRPTNTGRLMTRCLDSSEIRLRGLKSSPMDLENIFSPERETLLLYPSEKADIISPEYLQKIKKPITLLVPDGSWRQASKMPKREELLKNIPHIKLAHGPEPIYRLRKETKIGGMATFQAIARALGVIEGSKVQDELDKFFDIVAERTLWSRARLALEDCKSKIPDQARFA